MAAKQILPLLERWEKAQQHAEAVWTQIEQLTDYADSEGPLGKAVWGTFEAYTDTLSALIGDRDSWLDWYHLENKMGARGLHAKSANYKSARPICSITDLAKLLAAK